MDRCGAFAVGILSAAQTPNCGMIPIRDRDHQNLQGENMKRLSAILAFVLLFAGVPAIAQDEAIEVEGPAPQLSGLKAEVAQNVSDKQKRAGAWQRPQCTPNSCSPVC